MSNILNIWDEVTQQYVGIPAIQGEQGEDGISPTLSVTDITGGHRLTIVDKNGTKSVDIMDGLVGDTGTTFTPSVSAEGIISWTNDTGKPNPTPVDIKGPKGDNGDTPVKGVDYFDGAKGDPGTAATITVGTVTTGAAGTNASVTNVGTSSAAKLNFTIPRGNAGYTPVKGTDYWTNADKASIVQEVSGDMVIDNLTSTSADKALSAKQGKELKTMVDGKASSVHTHEKSQITDFPTSMPASDVSSWAKAATKPTYTASEVGAISLSAKGAANGVAELDAQGKVPSTQLPSYVDDVLEYDSIANFPANAENGKIYIDKNTNITYRWGGSSYVPIGSDLALGETEATAYRGDRGAIAYVHSQSAHAPSDAQKNVQSDWNATSGDAYIKNKPTAFPPAAHQHSAGEISGLPTSLPASDVPSWAKQPSKPTYTAAEVGARQDTWTPSATDVGADPAGSASAVQSSLNSHTGDNTKHITAADRMGWDSKASVHYGSSAPANEEDIWINPDADVENLFDALLDKSGGTMTGALTLSGDPTENLHAATKQYVDDHGNNTTKHITASERMAWNGKAGMYHDHTAYYITGGGLVEHIWVENDENLDVPGLRNVVLSTEDPEESDLFFDGTIWIKYKE